MDSAQLSLSFDKASLSDNGNARTRKSEYDLFDVSFSFLSFISVKEFNKAV